MVTGLIRDSSRRTVPVATVGRDGRCWLIVTVHLDVKLPITRMLREYLLRMVRRRRNVLSPDRSRLRPHARSDHGNCRRIRWRVQVRAALQRCRVIGPRVLEPFLLSELGRALGGMEKPVGPRTGSLLHTKVKTPKEHMPEHVLPDFWKRVKHDATAVCFKQTHKHDSCAPNMSLNRAKQ